MSTLPRIDPGTLGWVRTEIDDSLSHAGSKLEQFAINPNDVTPLRSFVADLHQVVGTLQMVELDGSAMLAKEIEALAQAMVRAEVDPAAQINLVRYGLTTLREHLDQLKLGYADVPLKLVPELNRLRLGRAAPELTVFELFTPDVSVYPPAGGENAAREWLGDEQFRKRAHEVRRGYQAALLSWLRDPTRRQALEQLAENLHTLDEVSRFATVRQIWWVASAFLEGLLEGGIAPSNERKALLGKIDQQLRQLVEDGEAALIRDPPESLIKALLFEIGNATQGGPRIAEIRASFELDALLGKDVDAALDVGQSNEKFIDALRGFGDDARTDIVQAQELLSRYFSPNAQVPALLESMEDHLLSIREVARRHELRPAIDLVSELQAAGNVLMQRGAIDFNRASLYMAAALLFLENTAQGRYTQESDWQEQADRRVRSLSNLVSGDSPAGFDEPEDIAPEWTDAELKHLLSVVAGETRVNLNNVEQALEIYSRDVTVIDVLDQTPAYLDQVQGALDILGQRRAAEMVAVGSQSIRDIRNGKLEPTPEVIDALAVAVGSAEAYVSGLEQGRENIGTLVDRAMREMHTSISGRRISHIEVATVLAEMHTQLDAWLEDTADGPAFRGLRQGLRDIATVADTRDEVRIGRIVAEVNNLLDIVSDDVGFLGEEVEAMLRRSLQTLTGLCEQFDTRPADALKPAVVDAVEGDTGVEDDDDGISQDEIMQIFLEETREALPAIDRLHGEWQADAHQARARADLRRYFHTLKGSGRLAGATAIAELCWCVENVLNKVIGGFSHADEALHRFVSNATQALVGLAAGDDAIDLGAWRRAADELLSTDGATMGTAPDDADSESLDDTVVRVFVSETLGHLRVIRDHVESGREAGECLVTDDLVRAAHTLQGSARSMGLEQMSNASANLDRVLQTLLSRDAALDAGDLKRLDDLHGLIARTIDRLNQDPSVPEDLDAEFSALSIAFKKRRTAADAAPSVADDDLEMRQVFKEEAVDILSRVNRTISACQAQGVDQSRLDDLRRELHTLKGGALAANAQAVADVSHHTESLLEHLSAGTSILDAPLLALLEEVHDSLAMAIDADDTSTTRSELTALSGRIVASAGTMQAAADTRQAADPADETLPGLAPEMTARKIDEEMPDPGAMPRSIATDAGPGQVRVGIDTLDTLVNFTGEVSVSRSRLQEQLLEAKENLRELRSNVSRFKDQLRELEIEAESRIASRAPDTESPEADFDPLEFDRYTRMQTLSRSLSESLDDLVAIQSGLDQFASVAGTMLQHQAQLTSQLQDGLIRTRMVSFATQVPWLRHIVRQTARELDKQADLAVSGADVEIDRNVLEPLLGPLEHMIRNAIAHGIEPVEQRTRIGKPSMAQIKVACREDDGEVIIDFSDDGAGLDFDAIRARARAAGIATGAEIADDEIIQLLVMPGVSTAAAVTQLSGRGVGMDVVNNAVRRLGGSITVRSELGRGATFSIRVPVNLSITHALLVSAADQVFAIPARLISKVVKAPAEEIAGREWLSIQEQRYPLMPLAKYLQLPLRAPEHGKATILLTRMGAQDIAVVVDDLIDTREIVVKPLGPKLGNIAGIGGATILGDGRVVLILDIPELWETHGSRPVAISPAAQSQSQPALPLVMVVDDSLTVRKVTRRDLEKQGFRVTTAKDGLDAMEQLDAALPDVMLVDIEMPRMNGYELTEKVRANPRTAHIPIVIITSRAGPKHRQKALELGANAYVTKPYQRADLLGHVRAMLGSGADADTDTPSPPQ